MRLSAFFSLTAHVGVVVAGLWASSEQMLPPEPSTPMIVIPLELMTIGDVTDIAAVVAEAPKEESAGHAGHGHGGMGGMGGMDM